MYNSFMHRLNSGIRNRNNFFVWATFLFQKIGNDSVNRADSGDFQFLVQLPGNSILEFSTNFWKCVGSAYLRGRFRVKIHENVVDLLIHVKSLSQDVHLPKCPRKCFNMDSPFLVLRELVLVRYHFKWFFKLYNLSYSDLSFIPWGRNFKNFRNST